MNLTPEAEFAKRLSEKPVVAILRGIKPSEIEAVAGALIDQNFRLIEVPLNSPDALESIRLLADGFGDQALVGAGTVLKRDQVIAVKQAGGRMIVSPNTNVDVIKASVEQGMLSLPGFATPSEAFTAVDAGAHGLKLFPADGCPPNVLKAMMAVLPPAVPVLAVGGVSDKNMADYWQAGAKGFGIGSALYKPGHSPADVIEAAKRFAAAITENI
ncbi:MAG: 2-dehydro-3-deoxy-6-phosphogalactonate aldolase [Alphaproteobacteria bacterium]|jgi:2-dehydro-3-deoxyphosphogalactonate aldolase|nr:2-dehydro-3-deoxy-6-phosphogalactonate aldolase [Alphaproteobacteria bacterium]MBT4018103.1 2-dehydro-3-deoxy-6-phosphogalactonate aldolase [Alphaproteobacteria bacterium]MBT4965737.1 2-dehydro-3-deoxy-6-phosphogalactonate aldolase [Alphaproteobacteria bacterium]MBT5158208.1 2-dehydro-3-deoxy-6-phosphogalactonate aldolase [Alphaproteobacteria bacterium]MBT5919304.1 2-dehydro-3-deoxy-6-phosphogalactonate aldolase [Alphaproteobacteria bacterium]